VYTFFSLDVSQEWNGICMKSEIFPEKVLQVRKKAVPLHPLSPKKLGLRHEERVL
jgi:hypothetical protein